MAIPLVVFCTFAAGFKILKIGRAYLVWFEPWVVAGVAVSGVAAAGLIFGVVLWWWSRRMHLQPRSGGAVLAVVAAIAAGEIAIALATGAVELMTLRLLGLLAWDLAVAAFLLGGLLALHVRHPRLAAGLSIAVAALLLLLYTIEAAFFLRTGTAGSWLLAKFLILSYDVKAAVAEDLDLLQLAWLLVPQGVLACAVLIARKRNTGSLEIHLGRRALPRKLAGAGLVLLIVAVLFPSDWLPPSYQPHRESLALSLIRDAVAGVPSPDGAAEIDFELPQYSADARAVPVPGAREKNVVVIVLESTRAASAPPLNDNGVWMPFLDSLAARSLVVERMYTTVPYTTEALLALFAGLVPPLDADSYDRYVRVGWPELLVARGYESAFFTATYLNPKRREREMLRRTGFSTIVAAEDIADEGVSLRTYSGVEDYAILSPVIAWVDSIAASSGRPFVLACLTQSSHHPYRLPSDTGLQSAPGDPELGLYLNTLAYADGFVREMYRAFDRRGLLDSTVFIVVGDHGESFGEKGARFHGMNVWEEGVRVPFLVHDPGDVRSDTLSGPYQQTDLFPTALHAAGFKLVNGAGSSRSVLDDPPHSRLYIASAGSQSMALIRGTTKYVYHYRRRPMQVFDLDTDPSESVDVAAGRSDEELEAVEIELLLWQSAVNAQESDL